MDKDFNSLGREYTKPEIKYSAGSRANTKTYHKKVYEVLNSNVKAEKLLQLLVFAEVTLINIRE